MRAHCNFAYSALASFRMGMSGSASFNGIQHQNAIVDDFLEPFCGLAARMRRQMRWPRT